MKTINKYIQEKFELNKNTKIIYKYFPKTREELREILENRLKENKNANLNDIDVSEITDMIGLFKNLDPHDIDISEWDVSNVTSMYNMFKECENFNSNLSKWNVRNVEDMYSMFEGCYKFNSDLSNWKVSKVKYTNNMFRNCPSLKNKPNWYNEKII